MSTTAFVFPPEDAGLGRAKKGVDYNRENYVLGTLGEGVMFAPATYSGTLATSAAQAYYACPARTKISKIMVFCTAISEAAGQLAFNIVLGTGTYTQNNAPGNDNSSVPGISYNAQGQAVGSGTAGATPAGGSGFCSNPAVAGNAMFATDITFNTTNFPNLTTGTGTGATYAQPFVPTSPDAVWPNCGLMTLRLLVPSGQSITNFGVFAVFEPGPLSASYPSAQQPPGYIPVPQIDF